MLVGIEVMAKLLLRYSFSLILILKKITVGFLRGLGPLWSASGPRRTTTVLRARRAWGSLPLS